MNFMFVSVKNIVYQSTNKTIKPHKATHRLLKPSYLSRSNFKNISASFCEKNLSPYFIFLMRTFFCSLWKIFCKASFRTFERCSRSKIQVGELSYLCGLLPHGQDGHGALGWHSFAKSFQNPGTFPFSHSLGPKDSKKSKFSHIDGRLPMPPSDSNLWSGPQ